MNLVHVDKSDIVIALDPREARGLLAALREHPEPFGPLGAELARQLAALGIEPAQPGPIRHEYMPPDDVDGAMPAA